MARRVVILGAAGRDFHNFNVFFRNNPGFEVVAFTATQIPNISGRVYPASLAGPGYPDGIPILPEDDLERIIEEKSVDIVVFSYSDVSHEHVMHLASRAVASGADFWLLGPGSTMLESRKPVIAVCAVRTGCGKSQTTRVVAGKLHELGKNVVIVRHPMPYGDLEKQAVQRFASLDDLDRYNCTIEEREEYEPHIRERRVVYAGVDYERILRMAENEADVILWDGGNNDFPFYKPDLLVVVADPLRVGHETRYWPGEAVARMADVLLINKENSATKEQVQRLVSNLKGLNPRAKIVHAKSVISWDHEPKGKRAVVVEDGPTITHGGMPYGAGYLAARKLGLEIVDPRPYLVGDLKQVFEKYSNIGSVLPAMGYGEKEIYELKEVIGSMPVDVIVLGTPSDVSRLLNLDLEFVKVRYELDEEAISELKTILYEFLNRRAYQ